MAAVRKDYVFATIHRADALTDTSIYNNIEKEFKFKIQYLDKKVIADKINLHSHLNYDNNEVLDINNMKIIGKSKIKFK